MFRGINSVTAIINNNNIIQYDNVYGNSYYSLFFLAVTSLGPLNLGRIFYRLNIDRAQMHIIFNVFHKMKKRRKRSLSHCDVT